MGSWKSPGNNLGKTVGTLSETLQLNAEELKLKMTGRSEMVLGRYSEG